MNTSTGEIYEGEKRDKKDISLDSATGAALLKLQDSERVNYYIHTQFDEWYKKYEGYSETAKRDRMRTAFRAGWETRNSVI